MPTAAPAAALTVDVAGTVATSNQAMLVLSRRLDGYDTFLTGTLELGDGTAEPVKILTFDDITVLRRTTTGDALPAGSAWSGKLHLPHGQRPRIVPTDLAETASSHRRDLTSLDSAELRYALTFLGEATTTDIRQARIDAIVAGLPTAGVES